MATGNGKVKIIDGDGHVIEDSAAIIKMMPSPFKERVWTSQLFPPLDHHHAAFMVDLPPNSFREVDANDWVNFMDGAGFESTVVYPTWGLAVGKYVEPPFARAATRAYNDWLHEFYTGPHDRIRGVGLIPMVDVGFAVEEMHRMVEELGFVGAMLPSNIVKGSLGSPEYHPIYAAAEKLGCALAVHGGAHDNYGINDFNNFAGYHAIGHPHGMVVSLTSMLFNGVFDKYPGVKIGFLEGGLAWLFMVLERCNGSYSAFRPYDPKDEMLKLNDGESMREYILRHVAAGRIYLGIEGDEPDIGYAVSQFGSEAFFFSSDFPHEVNEETIQAELDELDELESISAQDKANILRHNSERFYGLPA